MVSASSCVSERPLRVTLVRAIAAWRSATYDPAVLHHLGVGRAPERRRGLLTIGDSPRPADRVIERDALLHPADGTPTTWHR